MKTLLLFTTTTFLFLLTSADDSHRKLQTYSQSSDYVGLMLERVNQERAAQGLAALCTNSKLQESAQRHSDDQAAGDFMSHDGSDGSTMSQRVTEAGYDWQGVAENVAAGQVDVAEVMNAWMNSEGHRHNILGDFTMLGAAYAYNPDGRYHHFWTQDFGRSNSESCDGSNSTTSDTGSTAATQTSSSSDNTMTAPNRQSGRGTSSTAQLSCSFSLLVALVTTMLTCM